MFLLYSRGYLLKYRIKLCCVKKVQVWGVTVSYRCKSSNHYETLGVKQTASQKEIKDAYIKQCKLKHPDRNPLDKDSHKKFIALQEAYKVLSNPRDRRLYDHQVLPRDPYQYRNASQTGYRRPTRETYDHTQHAYYNRPEENPYYKEYRAYERWRRRKEYEREWSAYYKQRQTSDGSKDDDHFDWRSFEFQEMYRRSRQRKKHETDQEKQYQEWCEREWKESRREDGSSQYRKEREKYEERRYQGLYDEELAFSAMTRSIVYLWVAIIFFRIIGSLMLKRHSTGTYPHESDVYEEYREIVGANKIRDKEKAKREGLGDKAKKLD